MPDTSPIPITRIDSAQQLAQAHFRSIFGRHPTDTKAIELIRQIGLALGFSAIELPWSIVFLNLKAAMQTKPHEVKTLYDAVQYVMVMRGLSGLFTGASFEMTRQCFRQIVRIPGVTIVPEFYRSLFTQPTPWFFIPMLAGTTSALAEVLVTNWLEAWRVHRSTSGYDKDKQVEVRKYHPFQSLEQFFRGARPFAGRQLPAWNLFFLSSTLTFDFIKKYSPDGQVSYLSLAMAAPAVTASFILPPNILDVVKNIQTQSAKSDLQGKSILEAIKLLYQQHGARAFFLGSSASCVQRVLTSFFLLAIQKFSADQKNPANKATPATLCELKDRRQTFFKSKQESLEKFARGMVPIYPFQHSVRTLFAKNQSVRVSGKAIDRELVDENYYLFQKFGTI